MRFVVEASGHNIMSRVKTSQQILEAIFVCFLTFFFRETGLLFLPRDRSGPDEIIVLPTPGDKSDLCSQTTVSCLTLEVI